MSVNHYGKAVLLTMTLGGCVSDEKLEKTALKNCPDKQTLIEEVKKELMANGLGLQGEEDLVDEQLGDLIESTAKGKRVNFKPLRCIELRGKINKLICLTPGPHDAMSFRGSFVVEQDKKGNAKKARGIKEGDVKELIHKTSDVKKVTCRPVGLKKALRDQPPAISREGIDSALLCGDAVFYRNKTKDIIDMGVAE